MRVLLFSFFLLLSVSFQKHSSCERVHAAFDIGSGTVKMRVAKVNICELKILEYLNYTHLPVGHKQDLIQSTEQKFSKIIQQTGMAQICKLKKMAQKFGASKFRGVATSAFRTAKNSDEYLKKISENCGVDIRVIGQDEEGELSYKAVQIANPLYGNNIIVWDIGGGSTQLTRLSHDQKYDVLKGGVGAVSFKNLIIKDIQHKDILKNDSPNPMSSDDISKALKLSRELASKFKSKRFSKLFKSEKYKVIGIGGLHVFAIQDKVAPNQKKYNQTQVREALRLKTNKSDAELGSDDYVSTAVSNLILILGLMEELGINEVETFEVNLTVPILLE